MVNHPNDKYLMKTYGITADDWLEMCHKQGGVCKICKLHRKLSVDHDHKTGKVRGLLCYRCNVSLGFWEYLRPFVERYLSGK